MRWPWDKRLMRNANPFQEACGYIADAHAAIIEEVSAIRPLASLTLQDHLTALGETGCCLMHFADRTLTDTVGDERNIRMDKLVCQFISVLAELVQNHGRTSEEDALTAAREGFRELYNDRQEEYGGLGRDWFSKFLLRGSSHIVEALYAGDESLGLSADPDNPALQMVMDAEAVLARRCGDLLGKVPQLFIP